VTAKDPPHPEKRGAATDGAASDGPVFPQSSAGIAADDGDEFHFCSTCAFSNACMAQGMGKRELNDLHMLVEHIGPFHAGDHVFRRGDAFDAIAAVRAGSVKTTIIEADGSERVLGFHLPGEVIGLAGIDGDRYPCDAIALDTATLCRFSFPQMAQLASRVPHLQQQLFRLMSRDISAAQRLAGDWPADVRLSAFLMTLSQRLAARGFSPRRFQLTMARTDIGNYLRLAPETVSRVLKRFQDDELLAVDRREVELLDVARLEALAAPILRS
jgi:CRP/FNR family transcriptional regulator